MKGARRLLVLLVAVVAVAAPSGIAAGQMGGGKVVVEKPPRTGPVRVVPGTTIKVFGTDFDKNARPVDIRWDKEEGIVLDSVPVDARGEFVRELTVPPDATVGPHALVFIQRRIDDTELTPVAFGIDVVATGAEATVGAVQDVAAEEDDTEDGTGRAVVRAGGVVVALVLAIGLLANRRRRTPRTVDS